MTTHGQKLEREYSIDNATALDPSFARAVYIALEQGALFATEREELIAYVRSEAERQPPATPPCVDTLPGVCERRSLPSSLHEYLKRLLDRMDNNLRSAAKHPNPLTRNEAKARATAYQQAIADLFELQSEKVEDTLPMGVKE